jgi:hypothetical protein
MRKTGWIAAITALLIVSGTLYAVIAQEKKWEVHDTSRPLPGLVTPGDRFGVPPSDAVILFNGKDLSQWESAPPGKGSARWKIMDGVMTVGPPATGSIRTKASFGDCQLHIEWRAAEGSYNNSGVFLQSLYEIQIYDSYRNRNEIYADGMAASLYGQQVPLVNACRPAGQWQTYDVLFRAPRFDDRGKLLSPGKVTLLHNGVLVLFNAEIKGFTVHGKSAEYRVHASELPIMLQNHGNPVGFRNIWIRPLPAGDP